MVPTISPTVDGPLERKETPSRARAVQWMMDIILVGLGAQLDGERRARGWTVDRTAHEAGLSKRAQRKTQCAPRLNSLVARALAFGGVLEVTFRPGGAAGCGP
jgi:hypothetical protein